MDSVDDKHNKPASKQEEQAALLIEAWLRAKREEPGGLGPDCPAGLEIYAFSRGGLEVAACRRILLHLAGCGHCRQEERRRQEPGVPGVLVQGLRQAVRDNPLGVASLLEEVRGWLGEALAFSALQPAREEPRVLHGLFVPQEGQPPVPATVTLTRPVRLDQQGRLRLSAAADQAQPGCSLVLGLTDGRHRLELGAYDLGSGEVQVLVDCAFLGLPAGELLPCFLNCAVLPQDLAAKQVKPSLLPRWRAILREAQEAVEVWDQVLALITVAGGKWQEILRQELRQGEAPEAGLAVLEGIKSQIEVYRAVWRASNAEEPALAREIVAGLTEVAQGTQTRRRKSRELPPEATVVKKSVSPAGKMDNEKVETS